METADVKLEALDLHPDIRKGLSKANIRTANKVLWCSEAEIIRATGLSEAYAKHLIKTVSKACVRSVITAAARLKSTDCPEAYRRERLLLCPTLNPSVSHNYILTRSITELYGASGTGKTQICLQMAIQAQLPVQEGGLGGCVVMICTEGNFPSTRFQQMVQEFKKDNPKYEELSFSDNLCLCHFSNFNQVVRGLREIVSPLIKKNVKLLIIDSVAGMFRGEYQGNEAQKQSMDVLKLAMILWHMAQDHGIAIVCANQVSTVVDATSTEPKYTLIPALGTAWSNILTTRIMVQKTENTMSYRDSLPTTVRSMEMVFSSYLPNFMHHFIIHKSGVVFLDHL